MCVVLKPAAKMLCFIVNSLKDQLEDLKKRNQSSQISTEKVNQLQKQVGWSVCNVLSLSTPVHADCSVAKPLVLILKGMIL